MAGMTTTQTWLITGASRGLGLALVEQVLAAGHCVVATTRGTAIPVEHSRLTVRQLDPANRAACASAVAEAVRLHGRLDVLVNNAGYGLVGAIEEVSEAQARDIVDTDLFGPLWMSQSVLPQMRAQGSGHIVQVSSVGGVGAMPFLGLYNAAKWGLEGFSEALAGEVDAMGIRVTIAEIGAMDTQWATGSMRFASPRGVYDDLRAATLGTAQVPWPGDPDATGGGTSPEVVAALLVEHVAQENPGPLRLVLGEDAPAQIATVMRARAREYAGQAGWAGECRP